MDICVKCWGCQVTVPKVEQWCRVSTVQHDQVTQPAGQASRLQYLCRLINSAEWLVQPVTLTNLSSELKYSQKEWKLLMLVRIAKSFHTVCEYFYIICFFFDSIPTEPPPHHIRLTMPQSSYGTPVPQTICKKIVSCKFFWLLKSYIGLDIKQDEKP